MNAASVDAVGNSSAPLVVTNRRNDSLKILRVLTVLLLVSAVSAALTSTTTTLSSSLNPSTYGQSVTFKAVVTSSSGAPPNGEIITFLQGTNVLGTGALNGGSATFSISTLSTGGADKITAQYAGDATFAASKSAILEQVVDDAATTTSLISSQNPSNPGQTVTFTATVTVTPPGAGTPTGNVIFFNGSSRLGNGTVSSDGVATFSTANLNNGSHLITAHYNGSTSLNGSTSSVVNQVVGTSQSGTSTTTTLSSSLSPSTYGQAVTFTAMVTSSAGAPPNGETVTFMQGNNVLGTGTLASGSARLTISTLSAGTDRITAQYPGDSNFGGSTSPVFKQAVSDAATTTSLTSSLNPSNTGQSVTFTATVSAVPPGSGTPTGNVIFYNGSTRLGTASLSGGVASLTTESLGTAGTDSITATYNGSKSFDGSTSSPLSQVVGGGQYIDTSMTFDGVTRYYEVFVPSVLPANPPLLLMLHGTQTQTTPDPQAVISLDWGWPAVANQYEFILVKPASTYNAKSGQWNWNAYFMSAAFTSAEVGTCTTPPATACPDDAGFLRQLITNLTAEYNINPNQVYVAGFSSGAQMAERVGVEISDLVAAIVPASGQMEGQQAAPPPVLAPGPALAPISVQEWQGTNDTELPPCNYGKTGYSAVIYYLDTVDDTFNYWTGPNANNCSVFQTTQPLCLDDAPNNANDAPTPGLNGPTGNIATGCSASNIEVQFVWEPGVPHAYEPGYDTVRWQFMAAHPKQ